MCLEDVHSNAQVASKDIVVYKFVAITRYGYLRAPYRNKPYAKCGETMYGSLGHPNAKYEVNVGYHSFKTLTDAQVGMNLFTTEGPYWDGATKHILVKCHIPKGSEYYVGRFDEAPSFASDNLVILHPMSKFQIWRQRRKESKENVS